MGQDKKSTKLQQPNGKNSGQVFAPWAMKTPQHDQQKGSNQGWQRGTPKSEPHGAGIRQSCLGDGPSAAKEENGDQQKMQR